MKKINSFKIICNKCGGEEVYIKNDIASSADDNEIWGDVRLVCQNKDCNNEEVIYDISRD